MNKIFALFAAQLGSTQSVFITTVKDPESDDVEAILKNTIGNAYFFIAEGELTAEGDLPDKYFSTYWQGPIHKVSDKVFSY